MDNITLALAFLRIASDILSGNMLPESEISIGGNSLYYFYNDPIRSIEITLTPVDPKTKVIQERESCIIAYVPFEVPEITW